MSLQNSLLFKVGLDMSAAERGLKALGSKLSSTLAVVGLGGGFAGLTASVGAFAKGAIDAGAEAEAFESRLSSLMGSSSAARARLDELYTFAAETPFNTSQIVAAEVTMRGFGAAAEQLMPGLINFAALTGTELPQAAVDFGKAWTSGAASMESDGAKILRKQIEIREGVDASKLSIEDFRTAMLDTLSEGMFAGGADRLSRTFVGMISNLQDEWAAFGRSVSDAGIFNNVKGVLSVVLDLIKENRAEIGDLAKDISGKLWTAFEGAAIVAAAAATGVKGIGIGLDFAIGAAASFGQALILAAQPLRDIVMLLAKATGNDSLLGALQSADAQLRVTALTLGALSAEYGRSAAAAALSSTPLDDMRALLTEAKARAGEMADEIERGAQGAGAAASGGDGKEAPGGWEALLADFEKQLQAAEEFNAQIAALDDYRSETARKEMEERLAMNLAYLQAEAIGFEQAMDNEVAIRADAQSQIDAINAEATAVLNERHEEEMNRIAKEKAARIDSLATYVGWAGDAANLVADLWEGSSARQKAAHKTWAIASVLIDSAAGVMHEVAQSGLVGLASAIPIGIAAAGQIAQISKQHQGGVSSEVVYAHQGRYPDEYDRGNTRRLRQEATLNSQATRALGAAGVAALNGAQGASSPMVVEFHVGRAVQREVVGESLRAGGSIDRRITERQRTSDRVDVGFSGALAV